MAKRLKISLLQGWEKVDLDTPDAPATFHRPASKRPGVLQLSVQATYAGGEKPDTTPEVLIELARRMVTSDGGKVVSTNSGPCKFGSFGAVEGETSDSESIRIWVLSNGYDFLLATQLGTDGVPDKVDLEEAHSIVMNLDYR